MVVPRKAVSLGHWAHSLSETPPVTSSAVEAREITSWMNVEDIAKGVPPVAAATDELGSAVYCIIIIASMDSAPCAFGQVRPTPYDRMTGMAVSR